MQEKRSFIVAVGASAGGVEALRAFLAPFPAKPGMAFVIITHLGPGRPSLLPEILARYSAIPVVPITEGQPVEPDHVYVLAADDVLTIEGGRLHLRPSPAEQRERNPIDVFFASLAQDRPDEAIGVILSGGGSDGTLGIKAIRERGGLTMAQGTDHSAPRHESMPYSAISSGLIDVVVPVEEMANTLLDYVRSFAALGVQLEPTKAESLQAIYSLLREQVGHDFEGYKERPFVRRVHRRM